MLSLIKSRKKQQDGNRSGNKLIGKRSKSLISRPIEVLTSANLNKQSAQHQNNQFLVSEEDHHLHPQVGEDQSHHHQQQQQDHQVPSAASGVGAGDQQPQLVVNSSGSTVLLQSGGGLSFGFTAMELPITRPSSAMPPSERPSSRASNSSSRR